MFHQLLTPVGGSLPLSFSVAVLPIAAILFALGVLRRPAWQASIVALIAAVGIAVFVWRFPPSLALAAITNGVTFAAWPIIWIVFNALLLYNVAVKSGSFDACRSWILHHLPNDKRVVLVIVGFCFGALLEGIAGFGTPVAITSSLLILLGFGPMDALVCTLMFNTAPVAFAALGVPIATLSAVTHLPAHVLAQMVGRQVPLLALLLPFYVTTVFGGVRAARAVWPMLFVAGASFAVVQFLAANFAAYPLTDILSSLGSLAATLFFLRFWQPHVDERFAIDRVAQTARRSPTVSIWRATAPWAVVTATVILWTAAGLVNIGDTKVAWPVLHNGVSITLYHGMQYAAMWDFQPLGIGTAILIATVVTAVLLKLRPEQLLECAAQTWRQVKTAAITIMLVIALAYVMNYSGLNYTLGLGLSSIGTPFVFLAPFLGWLAVLLSGSDTAGNALFGNLQVISANQLGFDPVLFAATNSSGGVLGKMVSLQNIATGASVTNLTSEEGHIFARVFPHSVALTCVVGVIVAAQQFIAPWMIPH